MTEQATLPPPVEVDGPGVYSIPAEEYHARAELSSTGVRKLLPPSCPALFKHWSDSGEQTKREWDFGHGAHNLVLGDGPELVKVVGTGKAGPDTWATNADKDKVAEARAAGAVPLRPTDWDTVHTMADALAAHPFAGALFAKRKGRAEQTLIWRDDQTGVMCRALLDWLPDPAAGRFLLRDYKTGKSASPEKLGRVIADFGYHVQLAWHLSGCRTLGLAGEDAEALLVVQEKTAPYLVTVSQPDPAAMRMGAIRCREALRLFAECSATGHWPGYAEDVVLTELPPWETKELKGEVW